MAKKYCRKFGRSKGRKVCRAWSKPRKGRSSKGGVRGLSGLSGAALSSLAADLTRCVKYKKTASGKVRCASMLFGPGAPSALARAKKGVKHKYSYHGRKSGRVWGKVSKKVKRVRTALTRAATA